MEMNKCPLCKQEVSQKLFEEITGIWKARREQELQLKVKQKELLLQQKKAVAEIAKERQRMRTEQKTLIEKAIAERSKKFSTEIARLESQKNKALEDRRQMLLKQKDIIEKALASRQKKFSADMARLEAEKKKIADLAEKRILVAVAAAEARAKAAEKKADLARIMAQREANKAMKEQLEISLKKEVAKVSKKQGKELYRAQNTLNSTRKQVSTLQQQNMKQQEKILNMEKQLKDTTTPQIEGLLYEDQLLEALKKDFPQDKFTHTGKGGDILQEVMLNKEVCGLLVFECKKVSHWNSKHVEQSYLAKVKREADFAILVTNAPKKGSGGFFVEKGVIVVSPGGVLAITGILRDQVIKIARLKLTKSQKQEAVEQTMKYLQGAEFKNSLELVIKKTVEMYDDLKDECKDHIKIWKRRHDALKSVYLHTSRVQRRTINLIAGKPMDVDASLNPFPALPDLAQL